MTEPFGIYIHWPFCTAKCPYCDFNSHVRPGGVDEGRFAAAFGREMQTLRARTGPRQVTSIFIGGGTPSLMAPQTLAALLEAVHALWSVSPQAEITMEANPSSVEAGRFRDYRAAGVNRLSLGVQALDDTELKRLGRLHDAQQAIQAVDLARRIFPRLSFDLIYARPGQTEPAWRRELHQAMDLAADHLSLYQLEEQLSPSQQADEMLLMGLRLYEGLDLQRYEQVARQPLPQPAITAMQAEGLVEMAGNAHLRATAKGRIVLDYIIGKLAG